MILIENYEQVTAQIENERGVSKGTLTSAIEQALVAACRRKFSEEARLEAKINTVTGEARIMITKMVVSSDPQDPHLEIALKDAKKIESKAKAGQEISFEVTPGDFGRIAAQTAKQVIIQRIREAEKNAVLVEFKDKEGQIIIGTVQRIEDRNYLINLGHVEALLTPRDQIPGETLEVKERVRVYLSEVAITPRGPKLLISRSHPGLLSTLFRMEIPEIQDNIIEIMGVSREAGKRSKIAVKSNNPSVGAVGTCVGHMGGRIQSIIKELGNEKIDILEWDEDPRKFIANSLKPAKITEVIITNSTDKAAVVVVPNDQLSLAIGKQGVNVRLAVKLTGWNLDILSDDEYAKKSGEIQHENKLSIVDKIKSETAKMNSESPSPRPIEMVRPIEEADIDDDIPDDEKMKVAELAKELGLKTTELIEKATKRGLKIKNNRALLTPQEVEEIRAMFA